MIKYKWIMKVNLYVVGKLKEDYLKEAIKEYEKRLSRFCSFQIIEIQEEKNIKDQDSLINQVIEKESNRLLEKIKGDYYCFDIESELLTSVSFSELIKTNKDKNGYINFVIGGSNGLSNKIKTSSQKNLSFGRITLPHQLARVVALEQIYRAFTIIEGTKYNK